MRTARPHDNHPLQIQPDSFEQQVEHTDRIEVVRSNGWASLWGLLFLIPGLFCMVAPFLPVLSNQTGITWSTVGWSAFGLAFVIPGALMTLGRQGVVVDRKTQAVCRWWGLPFPLWQKRHSIQNVKHVSLQQETSSGEDATTEFPIRLIQPGGPIPFFAYESYHQARVQAERLADYLELPLHDHSTGNEVIREAGTLSQSLRERLRKADALPDRSTKPDTSAISIETAVDQVRVEIPPQAMKPASRTVLKASQGILVAAALALLFFLMQASYERSGGWGDFVMVTIILVGFSLLWLGLAGVLYRYGRKLAERATSVRVDRKTFWVRHHSTYEEREEFIHMDDLEELVVGNPVEDTGPTGEALLALSDTQTLTVGTGLTREELEWIRGEILFVVASDRAATP